MPVDRKVQAATLGGALGVIITWVLVTLGLDVPAEVGAAISTACAAVAGFFVPQPRSELEAKLEKETTP